MGKALIATLALCLAVLAAPSLAQDDESYLPFSDDQFDNLLAPIALYPDPLLAQVLIAATFPDQIDDASRFVRYDSDPDDIDDQPWDVSVKAVAHYPAVLDMMADKLDWTEALGDAYVNQSTDVMASVQRLRAEAERAGSLVSTPEMQVVNVDGMIELWPGQPEYIYVPEYDPGAVFFLRAPLFFGPRLLIGAWLGYDLDWRDHRVYYHGWEHGHGWVERSRPYIHVNHVYVNDRFRSVVVNRNISRQRLNYRALDRYDDVHRNTRFDERRGHERGGNPPPMERVTTYNKMIERNVDTADPRLREYRGHVTPPPSRPPVREAPAFTPFNGGFDPRQASRRGQSSRARVEPPRPSQPPRIAAPPHPPSPPHPPTRPEERKHK